MKKDKDWNVDTISDLVSNSDEDYKLDLKKRVPLHVRLIISCLILVISFTVLKIYFPDFADYVNQIASIIFALVGFIATSYKDYKNKTYNDLYGKGKKK